MERPNSRSVPEQCLDCINFSVSGQTCTMYEDFPGEGERKDIELCSSRVLREDQDSLYLLSKYIDMDGGPVERSVKELVDRILSGYSEKMKVMVVGIARRKIKSIIKMSNVIDNLLDRLDDESLDNLSASQSIRLLSELNSSINSDLAFIMKLLQPDSDLKNIQQYFDQRSVVTVIDQNGSSKKTNEMTNTVLEELSGTSRENVRRAFDMILETLRSEDRDSSDPISKVDYDEEGLEITEDEET